MALGSTAAISQFKGGLHRCLLSLSSSKSLSFVMGDAVYPGEGEFCVGDRIVGGEPLGLWEAILW